jgi:dihydroorotate dehydrogenase electron transfer subunit
MPKATDFVIEQQRQLTADVLAVDLKAAIKLTGYLPGRFVMVELPNELYQLRRPLAIADCQPDQGRLTLIYRVVGQGTKLLAELPAGTKLNVLGALGNGFNFQKLPVGSSVLLIGGGTGLPPLMYLAAALTKKGCQVETLVGFRTRKQIFGAEVFQKNGRFLLATDDGSAGVKGNVGTLLATWQKQNCCHVYACGPLGLLRAVQQKFKSWPNLPVDLSLESRMGCGMGACAGCMVSVNGSKWNQHVCLEGPIFNATEVKL